MASAMKTVKVEMVREVEEEEVREEAARMVVEKVEEEATTSYRLLRTPGKLASFLAGCKEEWHLHWSRCSQPSLAGQQRIFTSFGLINGRHTLPYVMQRTSPKPW